MKPTFKHLVLAVAWLSQSLAYAAPKVGDSFAVWVTNPAFKKLYVKALEKSPINHASSWVFKDAKLANSTSIEGQNGNNWLRLSTCSNPKVASECLHNRIDIFYDAQNEQLFAYLRTGNRVGWIGAPRNPISLEQKFFNTHLNPQ